MGKHVQCSGFFPLHQEKRRQPDTAAKIETLLFPEGLAVGALVHGGDGFMGAHLNAVQRAVILAAAMVGALLHGTFDALVRMAVHSSSSFGDG